MSTQNALPSPVVLSESVDMLTDNSADHFVGIRVEARRCTLETSSRVVVVVRVLSMTSSRGMAHKKLK